MTAATLHLAEIQAQLRIKADLGKQLANTIASRDANAHGLAATKSKATRLKVKLQDDHLAAILAGDDFETPVDVARALRRAADKIGPTEAALAVQDAQIAELRSAVSIAELKRTASAFSYSVGLQSIYAEDVKAGLLALLPHLAALASVDVFRQRHSKGAMAGIPAGGDKPWQGAQVIANFLAAIPAQLRPVNLSLDEIQREALKNIAIIEAELTEGTNNDRP